MRIVEVIPITRSVYKNSLTYYTTKRAEPGTLVSIPIRNQTIPAVVVSSTEAAETKGDLKSATYGLKKITHVGGHSLFLPSFLEAAKRGAIFFATTPGAIISAFVPKVALQNADAFGIAEIAPENTKKETGERVEPRKYEKLAFQAADDERFAAYKSLIRESFAKNQSVFFCLPTIEDIEGSRATLERGIEQYTFVLHGDLSKKETIARWQAAIAEKHPVLIIATGLFLSIPRKDMKVIVLEKESSSAYKLLTRPYVDIRTMAEFFAEAAEAKLILGDMLLQTETIYKKDAGVLEAFAPLKFRSVSRAENTLIDMTRYRNEAGGEKFRILGDEILHIIERLGERNERMLLFVSRRGLYPVTTCSDCNTVVLCRHCEAPLVLHTTGKGEKGRYHVCHTCGRSQRAEDRCATCGSWRLVPIGIGTESVFEEVKNHAKDVSVFLLSKDAAPTKKKVKEIMGQFTNAPSAILVATAMVLPYLREELPNVAVVSIDSLFTLPDFKINERVFRMLALLNARTSRRFLIQTRLPDTPLFRHVLLGNFLEFYREELADRKEFHLPPFTVLVKVSSAGTKEAVEHTGEKLKELFAEYNPTIFPGFIAKVKGKHILHMLIRVPAEHWPDLNLVSMLRALPPGFKIQVNPESIL
ncbi:MAG: hypothetical protein HY457_00830 [Parcubacteria group bacterium]|nr:hypothetical protein [Parcubacteria group bacterium]